MWNVEIYPRFFSTWKIMKYTNEQPRSRVGYTSVQIVSQTCPRVLQLYLFPRSHVVRYPWTTVLNVSRVSSHQITHVFSASAPCFSRIYPFVVIRSRLIPRCPVDPQVPQVYRYDRPTSPWHTNSTIVQPTQSILRRFKIWLCIQILDPTKTQLSIQFCNSRGTLEHNIFSKFLITVVQL